MRYLVVHVVSVRVAIVTESFPPDVNGVAHCVLRVAEHLVLRGHHPLVIAPAPARNAPGEVGSFPCPVVRLPSVPMPGYRGFRIGVPLPRWPVTPPTWCTSPARLSSAHRPSPPPGGRACPRWPCTRRTCPPTPASTGPGNSARRLRGGGCAESTTRPTATSPRPGPAPSACASTACGGSGSGAGASTPSGSTPPDAARGCGRSWP